MADRPLVSIEGAIEQATIMGLAIANPDATPTPTTGLIRLFQSSLGVPTANTTKAELVAAEADYTGYPSGGFDVLTMAPPMGAPGGGVVILSNEVFAVFTSGSPNTIGGYWLEDTAGNVIQIYIYDPVRTLAVVPDGFPIVAQLGFGRNAS